MRGLACRRTRSAWGDSGGTGHDAGHCGAAEFIQHVGCSLRFQPDIWRAWNFRQGLKPPALDFRRVSNRLNE